MLREKIKKLNEMGLTVTSIAKGAGVDNSLISKWIKGEKDVSQNTENKLTIWFENFKQEIKEVCGD